MKRILLKWIVLICVSFFGMAFFVACGGDGGNGGDDSCTGPVPCLTQDWGDTYYEFHAPNGNPIIINSDGNIFGGAGKNDDGNIIALAGDVIDCYNGNITVGGIDRRPIDGKIDYWFTSVSGNVNICNTTLRVSGVVIEGIPEPDIVATYVGVAKISEINEDQTGRKVPPEILFEILDKMSSEQ